MHHKQHNLTLVLDTVTKGNVSVGNHSVINVSTPSLSPYCHSVTEIVLFNYNNTEECKFLLINFFV